MPKILSIDDFPLKGKRILVRVDFNVPLNENQKITDDTRIVESLPTIKKIIELGGKVILLSHLGRPKGTTNLKFSLRPIVERLSGLLQKPVNFCEDCLGEKVEESVSKMKEGDVLVLENVRFYKEEEENDMFLPENYLSMEMFM